MNRDRAKELYDVYAHFMNGGDVESCNEVNDSWTLDFNPGWHDDWVYRKAVTKPSIDWSHVDEDFKWLSRDKNCSQWILHEKEPTSGDSIWSGSGREIVANNFTSFKPGTCDWKDSLVKRPE